MKKHLLIITVILFFSSCNNGDEDISFILTNEQPSYGNNYATLQGEIAAPGKVDIKNLGIQVTNITHGNTFTIDLGPRKTVGRFTYTIDTLSSATKYQYFFFARTAYGTRSSDMQTFITF